MEIEVIDYPQAVLVKVSGEMDAITAPDFDVMFKKETDAGKKIVCIRFFPAEVRNQRRFRRSVLTAAKALTGMQGSFVFCGIHGLVKELFDLSGFTKLFYHCGECRACAGRSWPGCGERRVAF